MTTPTGSRTPTTVQYNRGGYVVYYRYKAKSWQKAPYDLPLAYDYRCGFIEPGGTGFDTVGGPRHQADAMILANYEQRSGDFVVNESYERLRNAVHDSAGLGVDFVEYRQSLTSITNTLVTLANFTRHVKRLEFGRAANELRMHFVPPGVNKRKAWANNWLEFHFGWEPLVRDVYDSIDVLNNPLKSFSAVKGKAKDVRTGYFNDNLGSVTSSGQWRCDYSCLQGATVRSIDNQTFHTLDQLGILNPVSLAWEIIPFSFVVDWFANVGNRIRSLSDFAGMTLEKQYATFIVRSYEQGTVSVNPGFTVGPGVNPLRKFVGYGLYCSRVNHLYSPVFSVKPLRLPSAIRGITASALLSQQFEDVARRTRYSIPLSGARWRRGANG